MDRPRHQRVVISGIGLVTPLGGDRESSWRAIRSGRSAVRCLERFSAAGRTYLGAPAAPFTLHHNGSSGISEPVVRLAVHASEQALADAQLDLARSNRDRIACVIGTSKGGLHSFARAFGRLRRLQAGIKDNGSGACGECWEAYLPSSAASAVSAAFDLRGPLLCPVAACATGVLAVLQAAQAIRDGCCDMAVAGSADASLEPTVLAAFDRMGVLARDCGDPAAACRPFDARRHGFVVGEGAGVFVLESMASAARRGAPVYAELLAGASACEAYDLARLNPVPTTLCRTMELVLRRSGLEAAQLDYVNVHGTATHSNDRLETEALKRCFGRRAYQIPLSATKSMLGHLLGAAGSAELAVTALALRDGFIPPTINLTDPDPDCDLDYTALTGRRAPIEVALKVSLGFGGHVIVAALRRCPALTRARSALVGDV